MILAHNLTLAMCGNPSCRSVHIVFRDEDDNEIAIGAIAVDEMPGFIEALEDMARQVSVEHSQ